MEKRIIFKNVSKYYPLYFPTDFNLKTFLINASSILRRARENKYLVLQDLVLEICSGESVGIIGSNGAGKSTILALIANVIKQTSGSITINGRVAPLLEHGAGLHPYLLGRDNVVLNGILLGMTKNEVLSKLDQILDFSELKNFIDQPLYTYSGGMMVRLSLSVALHSNADIFLIDEVLSAIDNNFRKKVYGKIKELKTRGATMVLVLHDYALVKQFCDRIIEIREGKIYRDYLLLG